MPDAVIQVDNELVVSLLQHLDAVRDNGRQDMTVKHIATLVYTVCVVAKLMKVPESAIADLVSQSYAQVKVDERDKESDA